MKLHDRYSLRYKERYNYILRLPQEGIPAIMLEYLEINIKHDWGWYHDEDGIGIISFENDRDLTIVSLMIDRWKF